MVHPSNLVAKLGFLKKLLRSCIAPDHCIVCSAEGGLLCRAHWLQLRGELVSSVAAIDGLGFEVTALAQYGGVVEQIVQAVKYRGQFAVIPELALHTCRPEKLTNEAILIPIPSSKARLRGRGYHQAELYAVQLARCWGVKVGYYLKRTDNVISMVGLSRQQRLSHQLQFVAKKMSPGQEIWLIDDVLTTGHTLATAVGCFTSGLVRGAVVIAQTKIAQ